jgi:hypothetical protein
VNAAIINDPQNDVIGLATWTEDGDPKFDCDWLPTVTSSIDIESIEWTESGDNFTVNISFYGILNETLVNMSTIVVYIFILINGSTFPEDLETETPTAHFSLSSLANGTVTSSNNTVVSEAMEYGEKSLNWTFSKHIDPAIPVALENWDVAAYASWSWSFYSEDTGITTQYLLLDHYNFEYITQTILSICTLLDLKIPGYSLIVVGAVSILTIGVIIKKKIKK